MAPAIAAVGLPALISAGTAVGGAALQARAQQQQLEEQKRREQNENVGHYSDKISSIAEAFGAGEQNKSTAEADALKRILSGF